MPDCPKILSSDRKVLELFYQFLIVVCFKRKDDIAHRENLTPPKAEHTITVNKIHHRSLNLSKQNEIYGYHNCSVKLNAGFCNDFFFHKNAQVCFIIGLTSFWCLNE